MTAYSTEPTCPTVTLNGYVSAMAVAIVFVALFVPVGDLADLSHSVFHVLSDYTVLWLCMLVALLRLMDTPSQPLCATDVACGAALSLLAALAAGVWPWLALVALAACVLPRERARAMRSPLLLLTALGLHEALIVVLGRGLGEELLALDATLVRMLTGWLLPDLAVSGTSLQLAGGHVLTLVWGCSSLSYLGEMVLLCWATLLFLAGTSNPKRTWVPLVLAGSVTVAMNTARIAIMTTDLAAYEFLHDGYGASVFRAVSLASAAGIAWTWSCRNENA